MTQDVQPLTWQKRTNLEEHQQFFSKINEIIDNLAPTVDEAEAAIAQATAAIADANAAIATANAASAAASAAASQAQTAASTVAGYDTRLTAAEGDIDALQAADQTITGNVAALGTRMTAAESKNNQQDTSIAALQTADAQNVKLTGTHAIGNYAVLLTGNQTKTGILTMQSTVNTALEIKTQIPDLTSTPAGYPARDIVWLCADGAGICRIRFQVSPSGDRQLVCFMTDQAGSTHAKVLMSMTIDGVVS